MIGLGMALWAIKTQETLTENKKGMNKPNTCLEISTSVARTNILQ